ncbi:MAG: hypothetical protein FWF96_01355 [Kiritimatiellaeota bacterium]|nr:hypothetical protein [Kiritimatiellota bacterium]
MSIALKPDHLEKARALVAEARAHDGLAPLDVEQFWKDDETARRDPFSSDAPQPPLGLAGMSHECLFAELGVPEDWRRFYADPAWLRELAKPYNDKAEKIVGRRILDERPPPPPGYPHVRELHEMFGAENVFHHESFYLMQSMFSTDDLRRKLDHVEKLLDGDLRAFLLPPEWDAEKKRLKALGIGSPWYRHQRGPVTFAASIFGAENLVYLILDEPDLAKRFSDTILRAMLGRAHVLDVEADWRPDPDGGGWFAFSDDNSCLLTKEMYDFFAKPILKACFEKYAPGPKAMRFQHSDSDMAQHLETLNELGLTACNFGPNLTVAQIRGKMPRTRIDGQIAPFTFSRNEEVNLAAEVIRDCEMARETRGLNVATAGSINNGSRLTGLRLAMAAIQKFGRY